MNATLEEQKEEIEEIKEGVQFQLRREGTIDVILTGGPEGRCSVQNKLTSLRYECHIETKDISDRGFVYAQEDIASAFMKECGQVHMSCEVLAAQMAKVIHKGVTKEIDYAGNRVTVKISPPPYVGSASATVGFLDD